MLVKWNACFESALARAREDFMRPSPDYAARQATIMVAMADAGFDALIMAGRGVIAQNGYLMFSAGYCPVIRPAYVAFIKGMTRPLLFVTTPSDVWLAREAKAAAEPRLLAGESCAAALKPLLGGMKAPKIGIAGMEEKLSAGELLRWQKDFRGARFTSATRLVDDIKMRKSEADLAGLGEAAEMVDDAFSALLGALRAGAGFRAATGTAEAALRASGAVEILVYCSAAPHFLHRPFDRVPKSGDLITVFVEASTSQGYWVELARLLARGKLGRAARRVADASQSAMDVAQGSLRAGVPACEAYAAIAATVAEAGFSSGLWLGHGVGVDHDLPVIGQGDETVLEPGIVVAMHPHLVDEVAGCGGSLGETFVLADDGAHALSRHGRELIQL